MYGTNYGSVSGIIHLVARRPVVAATIVLAAVVVAKVPTLPPPPPTPPPPAVVEVMEKAIDSTDPSTGSHKHTMYTCEYGSKDTPTNVCKATLDSIAEFLQNDTAATLVVTGDIKHVVAVRRYFVQGESKLGIEASRIKIAADNDGGDTVSIEQIP